MTDPLLPPMTPEGTGTMADARITNDAFDRLHQALESEGGQDVEVSRADLTAMFECLWLLPGMDDELRAMDATRRALEVAAP